MKCRCWWSWTEPRCRWSVPNTRSGARRTWTWSSSWSKATTCVRAKTAIESECFVVTSAVSGRTDPLPLLRVGTKSSIRSLATCVTNARNLVDSAVLTALAPSPMASTSFDTCSRSTKCRHTTRTSATPNLTVESLGNGCKNCFWIKKCWEPGKSFLWLLFWYNSEREP